MEQEARERDLSRHLGSLYTCPTEVPLRVQGSSSSNDEYSARCLLVDGGLRDDRGQLQPSNSNGLGGGSRPSNAVPDDSSVSAARAASGPIREVFCRALPRLSASPTTTASAVQVTGESGSDPLLQVLGLMYEGLRVVYSSPETSAVGSAGSETPEREGVAEEATAQQARSLPLPLPHLTVCPRLHAGLVPLYTPAKASADGIFLVR